MPRPVTALVASLVSAAAVSVLGVATSTSSSAAETIPAVKARPADSLVNAVGVNIHLRYYSTAYSNYPAVKKGLLDLGVRHVRDQLVTIDNTVLARTRDLAAAGVKFDMIIGGWPGEGESPSTLVNTVATKLPGAVTSLEGANEWDISGSFFWPSQLRKHQSELYSAANANPATADLPVIAPALSRWQSYSTLGSLTGIADQQNGHLYPGGLPASTWIREYLDLGAKYLPGAPVVFTETGYHGALNTGSGHYPTSDKAAGVYTPNLVLEHFRAGSKRVYLYELVDQRSEPRLANKEMHFGLLNNDFTPKPAYTSLRKLLDLVEDPGPSFTPGALRYRVDAAPTGLKQVLVQKRNGTFVLLLWRDISIWDRIAEALLPVSSASPKVVFSSTRAVTVTRPATPGSSAKTYTASSVTVPVDDAVVALTIK